MLAAALVVALVAGVSLATPTFAANSALSVTKLVNGSSAATLAPGAEFTYTMAVGCSDINCVDAVLEDPLPAQFAGFAILNTTVTPSKQPSTHSFAGCTTVVTASCVLTASFTTPLGGGQVGIAGGDSYLVSITLKVPQDLDPTAAINGIAVPNTATVTSTTAGSVTSTADATVAIPTTVDTVVAKKWAPASQQFEPGVPSTISLTTRNTSNAPASTLSLQDPSIAADDESKLTAANPFAIVDFTGFGDVTLPQGANRVQVDAYVYDTATNKWGWTTGPPTAAAAIALPSGVTPGAVGGLRITFSDSASGATIVPSGTQGGVDLQVVQRSTNRTTGSSLITGTSLTNEAAGTVSVPGKPAVTKTDTAPYAIGALDVDVEAGKSIAPARIPAGTTAKATITGKNNSNGPLTSLTLSDTGYFTDKLAFGGFTAPIVRPAGATAATVTWYFSDGTSSVVPVPNNSTPVTPTAPPGKHITGFDLTYTGAIAVGVTASAAFGISPSADAASSVSPVAYPNTVTVTGTNPAGSKAATKQADLNVFLPAIKLSIEKEISPAEPVTPGGTVVAKLPTTTSTDSAFVNPTTIVVEDLWRTDTADDFWNAFNPVAIAPTQIPSGAGLLVEYRIGSTWTTLATVPATALPQLYQADLPAGEITGIRYTFTNADGFAQGTTVTPNAIFQARATLRDSPTTKTSLADGPSKSYANLGKASGTGAVAGGVTVTSPPVTDVADASIVSFTGDTGLIAGKRWQKPGFVGDLTIMNSQSGDEADSRLGWGVLTRGFTSVTVSDPATDAGDPTKTSFQAFDLKAVSPIGFGDDPKLKYDRIDSVELYYGGAWHAVPAPDSNWMDGSGFKGYGLTAAESEKTTGVRLVIKPNDAARVGSNDPLTPAPGSGVGSSASGATRPIGLVWELRNTVRVATANPSNWVTSSHGYNVTDPSTISNTVGIDGVRTGSPDSRATASDTLSLLDLPPGVKVTKKASVDKITIPNSADVAAGIYPTVDFTVTAQNTSGARASYLRVTDPMPCTIATVGSCTSGPSQWSANPFTAEYTTANPFERLTLTHIAFTVDAKQIDATAPNAVTLWHRNGSMSTTSTLSIQAAMALTPTQLLDVVGVSVVYQGSNPAVTGGTIAAGTDPVMVLSTQVRVHERSAPTTLVGPFTVENFSFGQSYDPVLTPGGVGSTPVDSSNAEVALLDGVLDIRATKTFSVPTILERNRATPVGVTLSTDQGKSTVATNEVRIEDNDPAFWSTFGLVSLGAVTLPAGSDQVRVDVQQNGEDSWTTGTFGATAVLPGVNPATVTGIRLVFNRADGDVFSHGSPPANWSAKAVLSVAVLDTLRGTTTPVPFPATVTNELKASSARSESPVVYTPATGKTSASIALDPGDFRLDVSKTPQGNLHTVAPGDSVPWTLTLKNAGTGYLNVSSAVDQLPATLTFDQETPRYSKNSGGLLSTSPSYVYDPATRKITFSWPKGGDRMAPGDSFTIQLGIILEPGLTSAERATNQFVVETAQTLGACLNTSGNGQGVLAGSAANQCGTSNYVQPVSGPSLVTFKGVKGDVTGSLVSGAIKPGDPTAQCVPDATGYYRSPCLANTVVGGSDEWKLQAVNSGTADYTKLTLVDPLPFAGDTLLATGLPRGSSYRPVFDGAHGLAMTGLPAGTSVLWQVTTAAAVCANWSSDPACSTDPVASQWTVGTAFTGDWAAVTGLRIVLDFTTSTGGVLPPGGAVDIRYQTVNTPASTVLPGRAPIATPVTGAVAWNQFGALAAVVGGAPLSRAPVKAGVTLVGGPVQVTKAVTGAAAAFAPNQFLVNLACTVAGATLNLGSNASLALNTANGFSARVDGIPLGASCVATEDGAVGAFGETSRSGSPATILVNATADGAGTVPTAQQATITNDYAFGALDITKAVSTLATVGTFGPFDFTLSCVSATGGTITLPAADRSFSLAAGATHTVTANTLPIGAVCSLAEIGSKSANSIATTGTGVVDDGAGSSTITVGEASAATVTNTFQAGTLSVLKTVDGSGADDFGSGPFTAAVRCTYGSPEQVLYDDAALPIVPDVPTLVDRVFPVGTVCTVAEVKTGGATSHDDPEAITITGPTGTDTIGAVTADVTNHFLVGELAIEKLRTGTDEAIAKFGAGPFVAQVVCTWVKDGVTLTVPLPDNGLVTLDAKNSYAASLDGIIVGASCVVTEPDAGLAVSTTFSPQSGTVTVLDPTTAEDPATVTITNHFEVGRLQLSKTVKSGVALKGADVAYDITVSNVGAVKALDFDVRDVLPAGATLVSTQAPKGQSQGVLDAGVVTWRVASLAPGDSVSFEVVLRFSAAGHFVNRAELPTLPGPWDPPVVNGDCSTDSSDASCAGVQISTLAFTGGSFAALGAGGGVLLFGGLALWFAAAYRRRRTV